jgi:hypothetical protein
MNQALRYDLMNRPPFSAEFSRNRPLSTGATPLNLYGNTLFTVYLYFTLNRICFISLNYSIPILNYSIPMNRKCFPELNYWSLIDRKSISTLNCWGLIDRNCISTLNYWNIKDRKSFPELNYWSLIDRNCISTLNCWGLTDRNLLPIHQNQPSMAPFSLPVLHKSDPVPGKNQLQKIEIYLLQGSSSTLVCTFSPKWRGSASIFTTVFRQLS